MRRQSQSRLYTVCVVVTLTVFAAFAARLADWQLIHGKEYRELAQNAGSSRRLAKNGRTSCQKTPRMKRRSVSVTD